MGDPEFFVQEHIREQHAKGLSSVIGINGLDCAGKTTLSFQLREHLRGQNTEVSLLHVDDFNDSVFQDSFYRRYVTNGVSAVELDNYYNRSICYSDLKEAILVGSIETNVLLVEGVFLYKPVLRELFTFKIFVDVDPQTATERYAKRRTQVGDTRPLAVMSDIWIPAFERYAKENNPRAISDMVIDS